MKVRNGFVSNSSSSSFIIVIKANSKVEKECADLFDFFINNIEKKYNNTDCFGGSVKNYVENMEYECEEMKKDINWAESKLKMLEKLAEDKNAVELFEYWKRKNSVRDERQRRYVDENGAFNIGSEIKMMERNIESKNDKLEETERKIDKVKKAISDDGGKMYVFSVDHHDFNFSIIKEIVKSSWVEVIEEIWK